MSDEERRAPDGLVDDWKKATTGYGKGDSQREGPFVNVSKNGAVDAGAEASEIAMTVASARGYDKYDWAWDFYASEVRGQILCLPVPLEKATKASGLVRWYTGKGAPRASWHLGGVLKDFRSLRPKTDVKCRVTIGTGPDGLPALIIPIAANLATQTQSRDSG